MSAGSRGWSGRSVRTNTTPWSSGAGCTRSVHEAPVWSPTPERENGSRMVRCLRVTWADPLFSPCGCPACGGRASLRRQLRVQTVDDGLGDVELFVAAQDGPRRDDHVEVL